MICKLAYRALRLGLALGVAGVVGTLHAQGVAPAGNPLDQLPQPRPLPDKADATPKLDLRPPPGAAAGRMDQPITPRRFDIEGVSALPFAEVAQRFAPLAGQTIALARLVAVAQDASARFRALGYPLSFAYLPEQDFAGGVVRVVVVEGHIGSIRIEGDAGIAEARLRAMADPLRTERPLRQATFERITQLLARLPGLTVEASAALPGSTDGATALVLKVRREPYNVSLGADLRQPTPRAVLAAVWNDPLWAGSQLSASTLLVEPSRERLLTLGYTQLVGNDGLVAKASISTYRGYPDESLGRGAPLERLNTNRRAELSVAKPLHLDAHSSLTASGGVYAVDNIDDYRVPASGATLSNNTRVRALFGQVAWLEQRADRSRNASLMLARGIDGLGAAADVRSNVPGLVMANPAQLEFTRVSVELGQRDRFANQWGTAATFAAQYSPNTLAASERVSFGGVRFGRGYAAGDAAGDSGWGLALEVNRRFSFDMRWLRQVEPYLLLEAAQLSNRLDTPSPARLRSAALGVRFSDGRHYNLDLALAKPTGDAAASNPARHPRLSLLLSYQLEAR